MERQSVRLFFLCSQVSCSRLLIVPTKKLLPDTLSDHETGQPVNDNWGLNPRLLRES